MSRLRVRSFVEADIATRQAIGLHAAIQRQFGVAGETRAMTDEEAQDWGAEPEGRRRWMVDWDDELIGHVTLRMVSGSHRHGRVGIGLFEPRRLGRGFGTEAMRRVLDELFDDSDGPSVLHRAELRVLSCNARAQASYFKLGFTVEGINRETCWLDGRWHDDWMMALLEQDWRRRQP